eukprot:scaffold18742_cov106-Isochrysis_galbana.AAC.6
MTWAPRARLACGSGSCGYACSRGRPAHPAHAVAQQPAFLAPCNPGAATRRLRPLRRVRARAVDLARGRAGWPRGHPETARREEEQRCDGGRLKESRRRAVARGGGGALPACSLDLAASAGVPHAAREGDDAAEHSLPRARLTEDKDAKGDDGKLVAVGEHHQRRGGHELLEVDGGVADGDTVDATEQEQRPLSRVKGGDLVHVAELAEARRREGERDEQQRAHAVVDHHHPLLGYVDWVERDEGALHEALEHGGAQVDAHEEEAEGRRVQVVPRVENHAGEREGHRKHRLQVELQRTVHKHCLGEEGRHGREVAHDDKRAHGGVIQREHRRREHQGKDRRYGAGPAPHVSRRPKVDRVAHAWHDDERRHGEEHLDDDDRDGQVGAAQNELIDDHHPRARRHEEAYRRDELESLPHVWYLCTRRGHTQQSLYYPPL